MKSILIISAFIVCLCIADETSAQTVAPPIQKTDSVFNEKDRTYYRDNVNDTVVASKRKNTTDSLDRRKNARKSSSSTTPQK